MKYWYRWKLVLVALVGSTGLVVGLGIPGSSAGASPGDRLDVVAMHTIPVTTTPIATPTLLRATKVRVVDDVQRLTVHAFDINADADDLIPAPGTTPGTVSPGDEVVINDQLTSTHEKNGSYAIVGYDSGTCVYTRTAPDGQSAGSPFNLIIESCLATAQLPHGTLSATGMVTTQAGEPMPATFTIIGGTGRYEDASGTMTLTFGKDFNTYTFALT
jgi:hypothetical protein